MSPIPKAEIMKKKYIARREAGLVEVKLYMPPAMKDRLLTAYHDLCDYYEVPEDLRPKRDR